jgi:hypothetical protein
MAIICRSSTVIYIKTGILYTPLTSFFSLAISIAFKVRFFATVLLTFGIVFAWRIVITAVFTLHKSSLVCGRINGAFIFSKGRKFRRIVRTF